MEDYDYFDPNYDDTTSSASGMSEFNVRKLDKNYEEIRIKKKKWEIVPGEKKHFIIRCYGSALFGKIRNATDGSYYNMRVGEKDEEQLFKVIVSDGRMGRRDPLMLYYDTPEQYERHRRTTVLPETKEKWYKRQLNYV
jgi:hypothetical protein